MSPSIWQILLVVILAVLLFGRGKISSLMGDVAKGITAFKRGMREGETEGAGQQNASSGRTIDEERTIDVNARDRDQSASRETTTPERERSQG